MRADVPDIPPGHLLVATPQLLDPHFADTVVLLVATDESGALGVVLNHPTSVPVAEVLETWQGLVCGPGVLFNGGPVGRDGALAVGALVDPNEVPVGWKGVFDGVGLVDLDTPVELVGACYSGLRIYAGYAGWGPGQLEEEVAEGSWHVVPARREDLFRDDTDDLVRQVLRRQPGELAWHSTRPLDPGWN